MQNTIPGDVFKTTPGHFDFQRAIFILGLVGEFLGADVDVDHLWHLVWAHLRRAPGSIQVERRFRTGGVAPQLNPLEPHHPRLLARLAAEEDADAPRPGLLAEREAEDKGLVRLPQA